MSLILRKKRDGTTIVEGEFPDRHTFPARWVERELGDLVSVTITVKTTQGNKEYDFKGFERIERDDGTDMPNFTGWIAEAVSDG